MIDGLREAMQSGRPMAWHVLSSQARTRAAWLSPLYHFTSVVRLAHTAAIPLPFVEELPSPTGDTPREDS